MKLFTAFHLNLSYSSIEEEQRAEVVEKCYWPLLRLAERTGFPFGIEAPAQTLEAVAALDPTWIAELRRMIHGGRVEFLASGYAQVIGPLVPHDVTSANLRVGNAVYERLLGVRPHVAVVNEQAYSAGLVPLYLDAGFRGLVVEWENARLAHPEWPASVRWQAQRARGADGRSIDVVWNSSLAFQKLQRLAHADLELEGYLAWLGAQAVRGDALCLYGSDVEVFDFRPGRYRTEAVLRESEWATIESALKRIADDPRFAFAAPSDVLRGAVGAPLRLESAAHPILVKKQAKYNLVRWAVTGRDDLAVNSACTQALEGLRASEGATDDDWRELCALWASDIRTHITERRFHGHRAKLDAFQARFPPPPPSAPSPSTPPPSTRREGRFLVVEGERVNLRLNAHRGLAIDGLWFGEKRGPPLCGTLEHGFYEEVPLLADWYSGHVVADLLGQHKVTDLARVSPTIRAAGPAVVVSAETPTPLGPIRKTLTITDAPRVDFEVQFGWERLPLCPVRLGNVTLHPGAFDRGTLGYRTANGGREAESYRLAGASVDHPDAVSVLISARSGLGMTDGVCDLGDARHGLRVRVDRTASALLGLLAYREVGDAWFCRLELSASEVDDTRKEWPGPPRPVRFSLEPAPPIEVPP